MRGLNEVFLGLALLGSASVAAAEEVTFRGDPIAVVLAPGKLTELVFPRVVADVAVGDEVAVKHAQGDSIVYLRPAKPAFETSLFVRLDGGYSIPVTIVRAEDSGRPVTVSMRVRLDPMVAPERTVAVAPLGSAPGGRKPAPYSEAALIRAMYRGEKLPGYSILEENRRVELELPELVVRRVRTWVSPVWDGLLVEIENTTDATIELDPLAFQGQGPQAPRLLYLYDQRLAPRPERASEAAVGAHRTHALLVRPAEKSGSAGSIPRAPAARTERGG